MCTPMCSHLARFFPKHPSSSSSKAGSLESCILPQLPLPPLASHRPKLKNRVSFCPVRVSPSRPRTHCRRVWGLQQRDRAEVPVELGGSGRVGPRAPLPGAGGGTGDGVPPGVRRLASVHGVPPPATRLQLAGGGRVGVARPAEGVGASQFLNLSSASSCACEIGLQASPPPLPPHLSMSSSSSNFVLFRD